MIKVRVSRFIVYCKHCGHTLGDRVLPHDLASKYAISAKEFCPKCEKMREVRLEIAEA